MTCRVQIIISDQPEVSKFEIFPGAMSQRWIKSSVTFGHAARKNSTFQGVFLSSFLILDLRSVKDL